MFEARLNQGSLLKKIFEAVKELATDVNIEVGEKGLEMQAMDNSLVSLVKLELRTEAFDQFRCDKPRSLGLNMATVSKVMKMCNNEDVVTLRHRDGTDNLVFVFENELERKTSEFKMRLLTIEDERMGVPEIEFDAHVNVTTKVYSQTIAQLIQFSDVIKILVSRAGTIEFVASGDAGDAKTSYSSTEGDNEIQIQAQNETKASFGSRNLMLFSKASPLATHMQMRLSDGQPLLVIFNLNDDPTIGTMTFFLAPKMDEE